MLLVALANTQTALIVLAAPLLVGLLALIMVAPLISLYIQAFFAGAPVPFGVLLGMRLRRTDARAIVHGYIRAAKAGLDVPIDRMEVHALAGGRVGDVLSGMILAKNGGLELTWEAGATIDLGEGGGTGKGVEQVVRERLKREGRTVKEDAEREEWHKREVGPWVGGRGR